MKILAIGDFHGKFPQKLKNECKKADIILCTGDFGGSDKLLKIVFKHYMTGWWNQVSNKKVKSYILEDYNSGKKILKELNSLEKPVYIIPGNWDFIAKSKLERTAGVNLEMYPPLIRKLKNLHYWKRGPRKLKGLNIVAFGNQVTAKEHLNPKGFLKNNKKKLNKKIKQNKKEITQVMKYGGKEIDIFLAHYTPFGFFDIVQYKGENPMNGKHVGFEGYTKFIKKFQPKIFICGHMHEYQGIKKLGKTKIIATGSAKEGKAALIEINKKQVKVKFLENLR